MFWIVLTAINVVVTVVNVYILLKYRKSYTLPSKEDIIRLKELNSYLRNLNNAGDELVDHLKNMYE